MGDDSSIFTKIIRGEIPCHKVYEDDLTFAFLDINPSSPGHTLVVPKEPARTLDELSDDSAQAIGRVLPRISKALLKATGASEFNVIQNNRLECIPERIPRSFPYRSENGRWQGTLISIQIFSCRSRRCSATIIFNQRFAGSSTFSIIKTSYPVRNSCRICRMHPISNPSCLVEQ